VESQPASGERQEIEKSLPPSQMAGTGEIITSDREQEITIDTPLYAATWSNKGGVLKSWKLKIS